MINILHHKGNKNQNNIEILSHLSKNGYHQENKQQMLVLVQGNEHLYTVDGNVTKCNYK
jgi:hypothetical protein